MQNFESFIRYRRLPRNAGVSFVMPQSLTEEFFTSEDAANSAPQGPESWDGDIYYGAGLKA